MIFSSFSIFNIFIFIKFFLSLSLSLSIFFYLVINIYQRIRDRGEKNKRTIANWLFQCNRGLSGGFENFDGKLQIFFLFSIFSFVLYLSSPFSFSIINLFQFFFELFINGINENCNKIRVQSISDWVLVIFYYIFFISCYD